MDERRSDGGLNVIGPKKLEEVAEKASIAFWKTVASELPEFKADALSHGTAIVLQWQMKEAIEQWIKESLASAEEPEEAPIEQRRTRTSNNGR